MKQKMLIKVSLMMTFSNHVQSCLSDQYKSHTLSIIFSFHLFFWHRLSNGVWRHYCIIFWLCQSHIFCSYFLMGSLRLLETERILLSLWAQMYILYPAMFWNMCTMQGTHCCSCYERYFHTSQLSSHHVNGMWV